MRITIIDFVKVLGALERFSMAETDQFSVLIWGDHDASRPDIPVDDVLAVAVVHRLEQRLDVLRRDFF